MLIHTAVVVCGYETSPWTSWTLSSASIPTADRDVSPVFDASFSNDSIYLIGGPRCTTCVYQYNISTDTIIQYDTLSNGGYSEGHKSAVLINDTIYYITQSGTIYTYNVVTKSESTLISYYSSLSMPCLVVNQLDPTKLYISHGYYGTSFHIFNLLEDTSIEGPSFAYTRFAPACIISNYNHLANGSYYYIIGGQSSRIERINLNLLHDVNVTNGINTAVEWEVFLTFSGSISGASTTFSSVRNIAVAQFANFIYLIGGWDGAKNNDILYLDIETGEIKYNGEYPISLYAAEAIFIDLGNLNRYLYVFGGTLHGSYTNRIYISNPFVVPTLEPTDLPTIVPSTIPSNIPTNIPTHIPTYTPTNIPTAIPSNQPTVIPSSQPTKMPSSRPTKFPSTRPTKFPSSQPTVIPSSRPSTVPSTIPSIIPTLTPRSITSFLPTPNVASTENNVSSANQVQIDATSVITVLIISVCITVVVLVVLGFKIVQWKSEKQAQILQRELELKQIQLKSLSINSINANEIGCVNGEIPKIKYNNKTQGDVANQNGLNNPNNNNGGDNNETEVSIEELYQDFDGDDDGNEGNIEGDLNNTTTINDFHDQVTNVDA